MTGGATGNGASPAGSEVSFIDIDDAAGIASASRLSGARHGPPFVNADLTDNRAIERAVSKIRTHVGPVDVLLNNAATLPLLDWESTTGPWDAVRVRCGRRRNSWSTGS